MQQTRVERALRYLAAVLVMVSALALLACAGGEDVRTVSATVPLNSSTVAAMLGQSFTFTNQSEGQDVKTTVVFNTASTFTLTQVRTDRTTTSSGNVTFGSCTFTNTAVSSSPPGSGPQVGDTQFFSTCNLMVSASSVTVGGGATNGTVTVAVTFVEGGGKTISLTSSPITLPVSIRSDGTLLVNNVSTGMKL